MATAAAAIHRNAAAFSEILGFISDLHLMAFRGASSAMRDLVQQCLQARIMLLFPSHFRLLPPEQRELTFCHRTIPNNLVRRATDRLVDQVGLQTYTGWMRVARKHDQDNPGTFLPVLEVPSDPDKWHLDPLSEGMRDDEQDVIQTQSRPRCSHDDNGGYGVALYCTYHHVIVDRYHSR